MWECVNPVPATLSPLYAHRDRVRTEAHVLGYIKIVYSLDEADASDLEEVVDHLPAVQETLYDAQDEPEIARYDLLARGAVALLDAREQGHDLGVGQHLELRRVHAAYFDFA